MKEYLDKDYVLRSVKQTSGDNRVPSGWIEVPEGAIELIHNEGNNSLYHFINSDGFLMSVRDMENGNGQWYEDTGNYKEWVDSVVVWQRSPSREYINKTTGEYRKTSEVVSGDQWIEIPDGKNVAYEHSCKGYVYFLDKPLWLTNHRCLWQRPTQPEALPFVGDGLCIETATGYQLDVVGLNTHGSRSRNDGESDISYRQYLMNFIIPSRTISQSLNDQYAEIEKVRQAQRENNHYFINVSDVDEVDFYEIAKRYNVADPAIQHILKKCLAIGNRGHKDLETDLRDILKTAKRALEINGFSL